jgi:hypothetical protein
LPFNGAGMFVRLRNWVADSAAGIKIRADYHDLEDDGFADGLSQCIVKDGQTTIMQNIPMNGKRIVAMQDPVNLQDAATKAYADLKLPLTGGTITGNLDVTGSIGALGHKTRPGVSGSYGASLFNFNWTGSVVEAWIDNSNIGALATQAYTNATANNAAAAAAAPKVNRAGDTMSGSLVVNGQLTAAQNYIRFTTPDTGGYLQWNGGGTYTLGGGGTVWHNGNLTPVLSVRLALWGDSGPNSGSINEVVGAVITGVSGTVAGGVLAVTGARWRYVQFQTPGGWYTVAVV